MGIIILVHSLLWVMQDFISSTVLPGVGVHGFGDLLEDGTHTHRRGTATSLRHGVRSKRTQTPTQHLSRMQTPRRQTDTFLQICLPKPILLK